MTHKMIKHFVFAMVACGSLSLPLVAVGGDKTPVPASYQDLLKNSMENKSGLTFYVKGQVIPAIVTKIIDERTVEARNQQFSRIIIRLDRVSALAMH